VGWCTKKINDHAYHQGTVAESIAGGSTATFSFNGTGVSFVSATCSRCGIAQVSLDSGPATTLDLYSVGDAPQKTVYTTSGLAQGPHTIKVIVTGQKNPSSSYYWVVVDGFDVISSAPSLPPPPTITGIVSRKTHGSAGTFDLPLSGDAADPTTEPRAPAAGSTHMLVFNFNKPLSGGTAAVVAGGAVTGTPSFVGTEMRVPVSNVSDMQYVTVAVSNVSSTDGGSGGSASVRIGFLAGDTNGSRTVTLSDVLLVNSVLAQPVNSTNFQRDVNTSGTLSLSDLLYVQNYLTRILPPP
jgi:hypothetical protein